MSVPAARCIRDRSRSPEILVAGGEVGVYSSPTSPSGSRMNIRTLAVHDSTARHPLEPGGRARPWDLSAQRHGVTSLTSSRPLLGYTEVRALAVISMLSSIFATLIGISGSVQFALDDYLSGSI